MRLVVEENGRADFAGSPRLTKVSFTICQLSERKGLSNKYWGLAQLVARQILTLKVIGSTPISPAMTNSVKGKECRLSGKMVNELKVWGMHSIPRRVISHFNMQV